MNRNRSHRPRRHHRPDLTAAEPAAVAIDRIYAENAAIVKRYLVVRCGSEALADDLTSITFEQALQRCLQGRANEVTTAWLITVARRRLVDHWRRTNRIRMVSIGEADEPGVEDQPLLGPEVADALRRMTPAHSQGLYLKYVTGQPTAHVAQELQVSYRAAESTLRRARAALRAQLAEGGSDDRLIA